MSDYTLNLTPTLYTYYRAHACKETPVLAALREYTHQAYADRAIMQIAPEQGQFLQVFIKAMQAAKVIEIGTFTGYSALCMALALPDHGRLITCDIDPEVTGVARQYWK